MIFSFDGCIPIKEIKGYFVLKKIFSSETIDQNETKLDQDGIWVVYYQNKKKQCSSSVPVIEIQAIFRLVPAEIVQLISYFKKLWFFNKSGAHNSGHNKDQYHKIITLHLNGA